MMKWLVIGQMLLAMLYWVLAVVDKDKERARNKLLAAIFWTLWVCMIHLSQMAPEL